MVLPMHPVIGIEQRVEQGVVVIIHAIPLHLVQRAEVLALHWGGNVDHRPVDQVPAIEQAGWAMELDAPHLLVVSDLVVE